MKPTSYPRSLVAGILFAAVGLLGGQRAGAIAYVATNTVVTNWSSAVTWSPNGVPGQNDTAEIRSGATVIVDTNAGSISYCGGLTIDVGGKLENVFTANGQSSLYLYGNLVNSNSGSAGFANGGSSGTKLVFVSGNPTWTGSGDTSAGKFYVTVNSGVTLDVSGLTTGIKFKSSGTTAFTVNGTLIAGAQTISANANPNNSFVLAAGATLQTANVNGITNTTGTAMLNYVATNVSLSTAANYIFNGSSDQGANGLPTAVNNLTISNAGGVTLKNPCTVNGSLSLSNGVLKTTANNLLTLAAAGSISGASPSAFVSGPLAQIYSGTGAKTFPVGTNGNYRAVSVNLTTASGPPTLTVTPNEPSTLGSSAGGVALFTNRDWTVASSVNSGNVCTLTVDGTGFTPANTGVLVDANGTTTNSFSTSFASPNYTASGISLTASSDFALGDCSPPASAPTNLVVTTPGCSPVAVKWNSVSGAASYNVYRKLNGGAYGAAIGSSVTTNYSDPTAISGSNYVYAVTAASACGAESAKSADSSAVVSAAGAYFISPPANLTVSNLFTATFSAAVVNTYSNQWQIFTNGDSVWRKIIGGTNTSYTTAATTTNMSGNQYRLVIYGCSVAITSAPATLTVVTNDPYAPIRQVRLTKLLAAASSASSVSNKAYGYWSTMNTNAGRVNLWSDLPVGSVSANMVSTFGRLESMALAYAQPACAYYTNASLAAAVADGLNWMNTNVYRPTGGQYDNWFHWEISGPENLNDTEVLLYPALTSTQISNYCAAVDNYGPDSANAAPNFNWPSLTGANISSAVLVAVLRGALEKNSAKLTEAQTNLSRTFPFVSNGDGFYTDGSFIFHGNVAYNGGYGLTQADDISSLVNLLYGSPWQITDPGLSNIYSWLTDGIEPFVYNGAMMDMVRGRGISSSEYTDGAQAIAVIQTVAQFAPADTAAALNAFAAAPRLAAGQFHFYNNDRVVALRSGFGFGLSLSSTRVNNYENETGVASAANNLHGYYTGDGMTYLYAGTTDANFTGDYWATVDYYHLPGTTAETNTTPLPNPTDQNWAGGAHVANTYGVAGMSIHPVNNTGTGYLTLFGKKSYFMLDNEIVCLGAGITCGDNNRIETTVENRRVGTAPTNNFYINGVQIAPVIGWTSNLTSASWCALDGVGGYYFPGGATNLFATFATNSGKWTDIHPTDSDSTIHTDGYLELYYKHGVKPTNATYAYVLLPNFSATSVSNYALSPDIIVLTNTAAVQAVSKPSLGVVAANFWTTGNNSAGLISVSDKASVITLQNSNTLSLGISDPTQTNNSLVTVTLNQSATSLLSADAGVSVVQLSPQIILTVDVGSAPGATFQASFASSGSTATNSIPPTITSVGMLGSSGQFQIQFTGNSNFTQTVLGSTNLSLPLTNWTVLGTATQISGGVFQFTDQNATNNAQRFYRLRSP